MKSWGKRILLLFGCLVAWGIGYRFGGFAAWFLFVGLTGALLYAVGIYLFSLRGLYVKRMLDKSICLVGDDLQVSVTLSFHSLLPLPWLIVQDEWLQGGSGQKLKYRKLLFPWFRRSVTVRYKLTALQRGVHELAGFEAHTGDLFGFVAIQRTTSASMKFIVYPKPTVLERPVMSFQAYGDHSAAKGPAWMTSPMVSGVREYRNGDPMQRIHWKSVARLGKLMTKEQERAASQKLMLLLDTAPATPPEASGPLLEQRVALAAGCFADAAAAHQSCGFASSSSSWRIAPTIRPDLTHAYETLACVSGRPGLPFPDLVRKEAAALPPDASMLCITSTLDGFLLSAVAQARSRNRAVHVVYVHGKASLSVQDREGAARLQALGCSFTEAPHPRSEWRKPCSVIDVTEPNKGQADSGLVREAEHGGAAHAQ